MNIPWRDELSRKNPRIGCLRVSQRAVPKLFTQAVSCWRIDRANHACQPMERGLVSLRFNKFLTTSLDGVCIYSQLLLRVCLMELYLWPDCLKIYQLFTALLQTEPGSHQKLAQSSIRIGCATYQDASPASGASVHQSHSAVNAFANECMATPLPLQPPMGMGAQQQKRVIDGAQVWKETRIINCPASLLTAQRTPRRILDSKENFNTLKTTSEVWGLGYRYHQQMWSPGLVVCLNQGNRSPPRHIMYKKEGSELTNLTMDNPYNGYC